MADPTTGFGLSTVPQPVYFPPNAGTFDPSQVTQNASSALDFYTKLQNYQAAQLAAKSEYAKAIAQGLGAVAQQPSATGAAIAQSQAAKAVADQTTQPYIGSYNAQAAAAALQARAAGAQAQNTAAGALAGAPFASVTGAANAAGAANTALAGLTQSQQDVKNAYLKAIASGSEAQMRLAWDNMMRVYQGAAPVDVPDISVVTKGPAAVGLSGASGAAAAPAALGMPASGWSPETELHLPATRTVAGAALSRGETPGSAGPEGTAGPAETASGVEVKPNPMQVAMNPGAYSTAEGGAVALPGEETAEETQGKGPLSAAAPAPVTAPPAGSTAQSGGVLASASPFASAAAPAAAPVAAAPVEGGGPLSGATAPVAPTSTPQVLGGIPAANAHPGPMIKSWRDESNAFQYTVMQTPDGPKVTKDPVPPELQTAEINAKNYAVAAGFDPKQFTKQDGSYNIPVSNNAVIAKYGQPTLPGNPQRGVPDETPNPAQGLDPKDLLAKRNEQLNASSDYVQKDVHPVIMSVQNGIGSIMKILDTNKPGTTGGLSGIKLATSIAAAIKQGEALIGAEDAHDTGKLEQLTVANQSLDALGQALIPYVRDRTLNRILAVEAPWLTNAVPGIEKLPEVNSIIANHLIGTLRDNLMYNQYLAEFQHEKGTLMGAEQAWIGYKKANPNFDSTGDINANAETPKEYFTRIQAHPDQESVPANTPLGIIQKNRLGVGGTAQAVSEPSATKPGATESGNSKQSAVDTSRQYNAVEIRHLPKNALVQGTNGQWYHGLGETPPAQ